LLKRKNTKVIKEAKNEDDSENSVSNSDDLEREPKDIEADL